MSEANRPAALIEPMTVEEYIRYEWTAERRHEYINGQLFKMPGEKAKNNRIALNISLLLVQQLRPKGYEVFAHDIKVSNRDRRNCYYPDVFATKEPQTEANEYIKYQPELIVEVISPGSRITDTVDKYIEYSAIPSLNYYVLVEPEVTYVTLYARSEAGGWEATLHTNLTDSLLLPLLKASLPLSEIYA